MDPSYIRRDELAARQDHRHLVRLMILDPWFRWVLLATAGVVFLVVLISVRLWRATPPDFTPEVRVSLLEYAQGWSLKRTARRLAEAGEDAPAVAALYSAIAKNPGDIEALRAVLRLLADSESMPDQSQRRASAIPSQLLRLTRTNADDVLVVAGYYRKRGLPAAVYELLDPRKDALPVKYDLIYLGSLIEGGRHEEYASRWPRHQTELANDPEFGLYHLAYQAIWGPESERRAAREALAAAAADPRRRVLALRLQLVLFAEVGDADGYGQTLDRLEGSHAARDYEHIGYWLQLVKAGRQAEARALAEAYIVRPETPGEVLCLGQAYLLLGMKEQAEQYLRSACVRFGGYVGAGVRQLWFDRANLVVSNENWRGLLALAREARAMPVVVNQLVGWIDFIEAVAHRRLGHADEALLAVRQSIRRGMPTAEIAVQAAGTMRELGYLDAARDILAPWESERDDDSTYWRILFQVAEAMKEDSALLLKAAVKLRRLNPGDRLWEFNYAVALIVNRQNAGEAVAITREMLARQPKLVAVRLNHAMALALTQRYDEAEKLILTLDPEHLTDIEKPSYYCCVFEVQLGLGNLEKARQALPWVRRARLFPNEVQWLKQAERQLAADGGTQRS
jgi:hypothetical protein